MNSQPPALDHLETTQRDVELVGIHQVFWLFHQPDKLGIKPLSSGSWIGDEGIYLGQYRYWLELLTRGMERAANG